MSFKSYLEGLRAIMDRIEREQADNIRRAGGLVAAALVSGGIIHAFGSGHSHLIADEAFFRAGGIAAVNPILDERLIFLEGALESTRAEREIGLASRLIERESARPEDAAIIISNSGRNAAPVEMAREMKARGRNRRARRMPGRRNRDCLGGARMGRTARPLRPPGHPATSEVTRATRR